MRGCFSAMAVGREAEEMALLFFTFFLAVAAVFVRPLPPHSFAHLTKEQLVAR